MRLKKNSILAGVSLLLFVSRYMYVDGHMFLVTLMQFDDTLDNYYNDIVDR